MNTNFFVFLIAVIAAIALIHIIYIVLLIMDNNKKEPQKELQISKDDILEQANLLFKQKKYKLVEKLCRRYLEVKPDHSELRFLLAKTLYANDNIYEAIKEGNNTLAKSENNPDVKLLLARCYKKVNQYSKAITELQDIIRNDNENIVAVRELSDIYLETNQKISAVKLLKQLSLLTENNQELQEIRTKIADLQIELENYNEAFEELNNILEVYPEDTETNKKLIELCINVQNYASAIEHCEKLLEVNENNSLSIWLLNHIVQLCTQTKDYDKAMYYYKMLLEHPFSDKIKTKMEIAKVLIASGQEEEGMTLLKELSETNKENIDIKRIMINTYINNKNFMPAIDLYKEIIDLVNPLDVNEIHTEMSNVFVKWAKHLFDKNEMDNCFKIFALAIQYDNTNAEVFYELGQVNAFIKNYNEAILQFKKAISLKPNVSKYYLAVANCYEALGNSYEQKDSLMLAVNTDEKNEEAMYKLALLHNSQNNTSAEIKLLEKIVALNPKHLDAKYQLALILEKQGNKKDALNLYKEIESIDYDFKNVQQNIEMLSKEDESQGL